MSTTAWIIIVIVVVVVVAVLAFVFHESPLNGTPCSR